MTECIEFGPVKAEFQQTHDDGIISDQFRIRVTELHVIMSDYSNFSHICSMILIYGSTRIYQITDQWIMNMSRGLGDIRTANSSFEILSERTHSSDVGTTRHESDAEQIKWDTRINDNDLNTTVGPDKLYYKSDNMWNINQNSIDQRKYNMMAASLMTDKYEAVSFDDDDFTSYKSNSHRGSECSDDIDIKCTTSHASQTVVNALVHIAELGRNVLLDMQIYCKKEIDMMNQKHCNVSIVHGNQPTRIDDGNYVKMNGMVVHDIFGILMTATDMAYSYHICRFEHYGKSDISSDEYARARYRTDRDFLVL